MQGSSSPVDLQHVFYMETTYSQMNLPSGPWDIIISLCAILAKKKEVEALSYNLWRLVRFLTRSLMCLKPGQYRSTDSRSGIISQHYGLWVTIFGRQLCSPLYYQRPLRVTIFDMAFKFHFKMNLHPLFLLENKPIITIYLYTGFVTV